MAAADDFGSHGDGNAVWTSAMSAAYGDGILPREREPRVARHRWWARKPPEEEAQDS
ncbi:hypothetical protein [Microbacterium sp. dk485]|uniref:hypothetical protein n=1 Tax=Microbacterium sp. dk485 TaxID=2560021 RepID=UPI001430EEF8|nr:hypothetical protein [Microbacterium sp. dk485]